MDEYRIPEANFGRLVKEVTKLNKRAAKLNCPPIDLKVVGEIFTDERVCNHNREGYCSKERGCFVTVKRMVITIEGEPPVIAGWELLARIEHTPNGNIIRSVPGKEAPERFRTRDKICDHCHTIRYRKDTFLVRHIDSGEVKQVGSGCIADFLGHRNPEALAHWLEWWHRLSSMLDDEQEYRGGFSGEARYLPTREILSFASAAIVRWGWVSRRQEREQEGRVTSTASRVCNALTATTARFKENQLFPTSDDQAIAEQALAWAQAVEAKSDYLNNIKVLASAEYIAWRDIGLVSSIIAAYQREEEREEQRRAEAKQNGASKYVGTIGERLELTVECVGVRYIENDFGTKTLFRFRDGDGNLILWFASANPAIDKGWSGVIKGTVKRHTEYRGTLETVLSRCKI